ncbi:hypothetical protein BDQ12DRAFT_684664 [Crucibulum laeve]|uniref:Uncharacterized protein n=1 Tax=Crucibulum laeve TaxID=68775 RepID=A0A5C3M0U8_9AGAR|nr:hypothetical protein BDQ12DRAFT_684664 [Crucibulum laeve]
MRTDIPSSCPHTPPSPRPSLRYPMSKQVPERRWFYDSTLSKDSIKQVNQTKEVGDTYAQGVCKSLVEWNSIV